MIHDVNEESVDIIGAVDQKILGARTRSLDLSFNELLDMYESEELIIDPDYQRLFRWSPGKQSRFIESLILELPIPPIFVIERKEGVYELIDGLQRISSYLHFRGVLRHPPTEPDIEITEQEDGMLMELDLQDGNMDDDALQDGNEEDFRQPLALVECDIVKELNGLTYDSLPAALKIKLKRSFIRVEVIRKESDERLRYYMFKRLNTGGETLSNQEIRNCTVRLLAEGDKFNDFVIRMSQDENYKICCSLLSPEKRKNRFDQELVLRFFAFKNDRGNYIHDINDFITEYMEKVADPENGIPFNYEAEEEVFRKTFLVLNNILGEVAFSPISRSGGYIRRFSPLHYEAFTLGIQPALNNLDIEDEQDVENFKGMIEAIKRDADFIQMTTGGGKNYRRLQDERVDFVESRMRPTDALE